MNKVDTALQRFEQGYNCAQVVCAAFGPELGLDLETCFAVAAPFGAGMGREGEVCGAVSGALVILGLRHGRAEPDPLVLKERVYACTQEFLAQFKARNRTLICRELLGCDLRTPEGRQAMKERDLHHAICEKLVRDAVETLDGMTG